MILLDGKKVSSNIIEDIKKDIIENNLSLGLAIILIGDDEASKIYVKNKIKNCDYVGIKTYLYHLDSNVTESEVIELIEELNNRDDINGIILQSPTPKHIDEINCFNYINPKKDVDGFSNITVGNLCQGKPSVLSCTPYGILELLDYYKIDIAGKNIVIINRTNIVGKPLMQLLLARDATVTMCHSQTKNIEIFTRNADVVVTAVGIPNFLKGSMIKKDAVVVDVGISRLNGKVVGDVELSSVFKKASYVTPVPGGVGPMTIAMLLENLVMLGKGK